MKDKILDAMKSMGFLLEKKDSNYQFRYELKYYRLMFDEKDEDFLTISLPTWLEFEDENNSRLYQLMDMINGTIKYVKAKKYKEDKKKKESIWLFYERDLSGDENLMQVLASMIYYLDEGFEFLYEVMPKIEGDDDVATEEPENEVDADNKENEI